MQKITIAPRKKRGGRGRIEEKNAAFDDGRANCMISLPLNRFLLKSGSPE